MKKNKLNWLYVIIAILFIILCIVTAVMFSQLKPVKSGAFNNRADTNKVIIINNKVSDKEIVDAAVGNVTKDESDRLIDLYNKFKNINDDTMMYIRIRGTNIDLPVVTQREICSEHNKLDNCFYLYRNIYKNTAVNETAVAFVDCSNCITEDVNDFDKNTTVYGHTWRRQEGWGEAPRIGDPTDYQFAQLVSYTDLDWLHKHKVLELNTGGEDTYWIPQFVVYTDCVSSENPDGFNYAKRYHTAEDIDMLYNRSVIVNNTPVNRETDKLLTLSTCNYKYTNDNTTRFIVVFKLIQANNYEEALEAANKQATYIQKQNDTSWVK